MLRGRRLYGPFQLSLLGHVRVAFSWFQGPILLRRWVVPVGAMALALGVAAGTLAGMRSAAVDTREVTYPANIQHSPTPGSAIAINMPGFECHAMQQWGPRSGPVSGPVVVVTDSSGVPYGPDCLVSSGVTGRP